MTVDPRHTPEYQRRRKAFISTAPDGTPCALCGYPVDTTLPGRHKWGPTVEHVFPVRDYPDLALDVEHWRVAHLHCQRRQGAQAGNRSPKRRRPTSGRPSPGTQPYHPRRPPERDW